MHNLYGLDRDALEELMTSYEAPRFHADQIYRWLYARDELDPTSWTDLPRRLRERICRERRVAAGKIVDARAASDGTVKYRVELPAGGAVEAVYMEQGDRRTLCISSQVGCALACEFCLTGKMGLSRHLSAGEIVGQVALMREEHSLASRSFNIVFMGMGEPLHNFDGVIAAFRVLTDPNGFGLSRRRITISTAGLAPAIERLAELPSRPRLAVSLNATTDAARRRLMPITRRYPLARLLRACDEFTRQTGERFSFEYVLLAGINDTAEDAARLVRIAKPRAAKLNLIPFNPVPELLDYRPPARERVIELRDRLLEGGVPTSIRWSRGLEARAACGQLALLSGEVR